MPKYSKSERTARKARKQARLDAAADLEQEQEQAQAQAQARLEELVAEYAQLKKKALNKKNSSRKKAKKAAAQQDTVEAGGSADRDSEDVKDLAESLPYRVVVHASASCEEDDDEVLAKWDAEEELRVAQQAPAMHAVNAASSPPCSPVQVMPPLATPTPSPTQVLAPTQAASEQFTGTSERKRGTARMQCGLTAARRTPGYEAELKKLPKLKRGPLSSESERSCSESEEEEEDEEEEEEVSSEGESEADSMSSKEKAYMKEKRVRDRAEERFEAEKKENTDLHDERVIRLTSSGYNVRESVEALAATKQEGLESTVRAADYLRAKSSTPISNVQRTVDAISRNLTPASRTEEFGPHLSDLVSEHQEWEAEAKRAKAYHDASSFGHLSCSSKAALALRQQLLKGKAEGSWGKGLGAICLAICQDCLKCAANKAKILERETLDRAKLLQEEEPRDGRVPTPWKDKDSKVDATLPYLDCYVCVARPDAEQNKDDYVNHCQNTACGLAAHRDCDRFIGWNEAGVTKYFCKNCTRARQDAHDEGLRTAALRAAAGGSAAQDSAPRYANAQHNAGTGRSAPNRQGDAALHRRREATPPPPSPRSRTSGWDCEGHGGNPPGPRSELPHDMQSLIQFMTDFKEKKSEKSTGPPDSHTLRQGTDPTATRTASRPVDFTNHNSVTMASNATNTNVKISNYVMWDESTGAGKPKQGTETGSGVQAWAWFKRTNIPIRDAAVNMKGGLGLLAAYAITHNMQITLAAGMLNEPEVHPRPNMTESEIDEWVKTDMEFKWFKTLPDEVFIKVMNRLYASVNPAPFFRLVIAADIPELKEGDLYYPVEEFQAHCDKWISTLSTLIKGGWAADTTDLREVFLASISTCTLVLNQAKREKTEDVLRLIATLKKWIIVQDNDIQSAKAAKLAIKSKVKAKEAVIPEETEKSFEKRVKALFTQMQGQRSEPKEQGQQKASDTPEWQCQECGNKWQDTKSKPHRCRKECIYSEHKDANKTGKPYPKGTPPLSWKAYGQAYPAKQQAFFDKRDALKGAGVAKKL
jgi:hypothetical protein